MARCMRMDCCKLRHIFSVFLNQRQHNGERRALPHFAVHRYGAVGKLHTIDMRRKDDMRLNVSTSIDVTAREKAGDNLLFLGFHGFSNDENEMIRIIDAIYDVPKQDASSTDNSIAPAQHPNYLLSFSEARTNVLTSEATKTQHPLAKTSPREKEHPGCRQTGRQRGAHPAHHQLCKIAYINLH